MFQKLCGDDALKNVILVTTMWSQVDVDVGRKREDELHQSSEFWKPLIELGARTRWYDGTYNSTKDIVSLLAKAEPVALKIQRKLDNLLDELRTLGHTSAGKEVWKQVEELKKTILLELGTVRCDMKTMQGIPLAVARGERERLKGLLAIIENELNVLDKRWWKPKRWLCMVFA